MLRVSAIIPVVVTIKLFSVSHKFFLYLPYDTEYAIRLGPCVVCLLCSTKASLSVWCQEGNEYSIKLIYGGFDQRWLKDQATKWKKLEYINDAF